MLSHHLLLPSPDRAFPGTHLHSAVHRPLRSIPPADVALGERVRHRHGRLPRRARHARRDASRRLRRLVPGLPRLTNIFRNTISFLTETALYRYATPHFYAVNDFPRDRQDLRTEIFYSSPWKGGWWRLGDAVRYMLGASMAVLDTAAKYREALLFDRYQAARDMIERFAKDPPYAYVIPRHSATPTPPRCWSTSC